MIVGSGNVFLVVISVSTFSSKQTVHLK